MPHSPAHALPARVPAPEPARVRVRAGRWRGAGAVAAAGLALAALPVGASSAGAAPAPDPAGGPAASEAERQGQRAAAVVVAEDRRLTQVRTVTVLNRWQGDSATSPYRLSTAGGYTLVLTPQAEPYTVEDLLSLAPQTFLRLSDGSFLLSEHVVVMSKATLRLSSPGGLTVRLASSSRGFATIVSLGGRIEVDGEQAAPVRISSWDLDEGAPDTDLADGRAYVRAVGGQFDANYLQLSDLGFWSGRTGGLALTGSDRPDTGSLERVGKQAPADSGAASVLDGVTSQPAGPLAAGQTNPGLDYTVPAVNYVATRLANTTVERNAFGLFVSSANGLQITESTFSDNLVAGVVLHRFVTNGVITKTRSLRNAGDGFSLQRATTGITLSEVTAQGNAANGIELSGRPLSEGPSATGLTTSSYGGNSITNSRSQDNGRYGIQVLGGFNIGVQNNYVSGNDMGIVVTGPADRIAVTGNNVSTSTRHAIALVDGVSESTVTGNVVDGAATGVYLRGSSGLVKGNTIEDASSHGLSLVGQVQGTEVGFNVLSGSGASALDTRRSSGEFVSQGNEDGGWQDTSPWYLVFKKLLQPMTALWACLALLLLVSAVRSRSRSARSVGATALHPYDHQMAHRRPDVEAPLTIDLRTPAHTGAGSR